MRYVIEISDSEGTSCRIRISVPFMPHAADHENSSWRVLDEGLLRFRSGGCGVEKAEGHVPLNVYLDVGRHWVVQIRNMFDWLGLVNASGTGRVPQSNCLAMKPGQITWSLLE